MDTVRAEVEILKYKLDRIRSHIERRLSVVDDAEAVELNYVLNMIKDYEVVPAGWRLERPLVERKVENE